MIYFTQHHNSLKQFDLSLTRHAPKIFLHLHRERITNVYAWQWFLTMFAGQPSTFSFEWIGRVWSAVISRGLPALIQASLAVVTYLQGTKTHPMEK
jgi:hypothetical protein